MKIFLLILFTASGVYIEIIAWAGGKGWSDIILAAVGIMVSTWQGRCRLCYAVCKLLYSNADVAAAA